MNKHQIRDRVKIINHQLIDIHKNDCGYLVRIYDQIFSYPFAVKLDLNDIEHIIATNFWGGLEYARPAVDNFYNALIKYIKIAEYNNKLKSILEE